MQLGDKKLFTLRYRKGSIGVQTGLITAQSIGIAEQVGQWWCNQHPNCRYIGVVEAIIADESDMPGAAPAESDQKKVQQKKAS